MVRIRRLDRQSEADKSRFLNLFETVFGQPMSRQEFDWKYGQDHFPSGNPAVIVAESDSEIVGSRGFWPAAFQTTSTVVFGAQSCDLMIHPGYRGRGIYRAMEDMFFDLVDRRGFRFVYSFPNASHRPILEARDWLKAAELQPWIRILRLEDVVRSRWPRLAVTEPLLRLLNPLFNREPSIPATGRAFEVRAVDSGQFPELLQRLPPLSLPVNASADIHRLRDGIYLSKRFGAPASRPSPVRDYALEIAQSGKELLGFLIWERVESQSVAPRHPQRARIVDFWVDPAIGSLSEKVAFHLVADTVSHAAGEGLSWVQWSGAGMPEKMKCLGWNRFLRLGEPLQVMIYPCGPPPVPGKTWDEIDWYFSLGDCDAF